MPLLERSAPVTQLRQFVLLEQEVQSWSAQGEHCTPFQKKSVKQAHVPLLDKVAFRIHDVQFVLLEHDEHIGLAHDEQLIPTK